jgi:hypothetical protein
MLILSLGLGFKSNNFSLGLKNQVFGLCLGSLTLVLVVALMLLLYGLVNKRTRPHPKFYFLTSEEIGEEIFRFP